MATVTSDDVATLTASTRKLSDVTETGDGISLSHEHINEILCDLSE